MFDSTKKNEYKDDLARRISLCAEKVGSITKLATDSGIIFRTMQTYTSGQSSPSAMNAYLIAEAAQVDAGWLLTGRGDMQLGQAGNAIKEASPQKSDKIDIPVLDVEVSAGNGSHSEEEHGNGTIAFQRKYLAGRGLQANQLRIVFAKGDSMEPEIQDGAAMLVNMADQRLDDGCIYVLRLSDHLFAKRVQRGFDGSVSLMSTNSQYSAMPVPADRMDDLTVIGRVVWSGREH